MLSQLLLLPALAFSAAVLIGESREIPPLGDRASGVATNPPSIREVRLRQILILVPSDANERQYAEAFHRANELRQRVVSGEDFAVLARNYSQDVVSASNGGDLGWVRRRALIQAIDDAAFSLTPGEVSSVIRTIFGMHIIKVEAVRDR